MTDSIAYSGNYSGAVATEPRNYSAPALRPSRFNAPTLSRHTEGTLTVGSGITIKGELKNVSVLIVEGTVDTAFLTAHQLIVAPRGTFIGHAVVEIAEIAGTFNGFLSANQELIVRDTGHIRGIGKIGRLRVDDGGRISGRIEMVKLNVESDRALSFKVHADDDWKTLIIHLNGNPTFCVSTETPKEDQSVVPVALYWPGWSSIDSLTTFIAGLFQIWGHIRVHSESESEGLSALPIIDMKSTNETERTVRKILEEQFDTSEINICIECTEIPVSIDFWTSLKPQSAPENLTPEVGLLIEAGFLRDVLFQRVFFELIISTANIERLSIDEVVKIMNIIIEGPDSFNRSTDTVQFFNEWPA